MIIEFIVLIALSLLGGWVSRMCGGGWPTLPLGLDQWIFAVPFGLVLPLLVGFSLDITLIGFILLAYLGAFLGKRKGHGQWMDVGNMPYSPSGRESLDYIVALFFGPDEGFEKDRDLFGLVISGLFIHLGLIVALTYFGFYVGAGIVALGGVLKSVSYWLGWSLFPRTKKPRKDVFLELNYPTGFGEFLTGIFSYLSIGGAYIYYACL